MTLAEKIFALHSTFPFSLLKSQELLVVANAFVLRDYKPGVILCPKDEVINRLYVRIKGDLVNIDGVLMHPVVGTTCLLTGNPTPYTILAGPLGYQGLVLNRGKFYTLVNECPSLLLGFFQMPLLGIDYIAQAPAPKP